ncbi:hypothetical protein CFP59_09492 [Streptomyces malaysiensis subsp. malaysiensis]|uniref:hypothetical protein n=1 Tax=Streptomyces malaysiensis TaxID=92644 RepID=UPI000CA35565|nr:MULTISPECIES: hypothetical protein [unclassified Streptomyces]AUA17298.1 hypothetical protein CFP59_09492 [Streptomyces sp. M56]
MNRRIADTTTVCRIQAPSNLIDIPELATIAARHITRRTTASGTRARVRTKAVLITPTGSGTGRVGVQAIASGSTRLRPLIAEAARQVVCAWPSPPAWPRPAT